MANFRVGVVCNTGTTGKSHIREVGANKTLCGKPVITPNKGDAQLHMGDATCNRCRRIAGLPDLVIWVKKTGTGLMVTGD